MLFTSLDVATLTLSISFILAGYLTFACWSPPNPNPSGPTASLPQDSVGVSTRAVQGRRLTTITLWVWHVLLIVFYPSPPTMLCPNPDNLSSSLFTWSAYTTVALVTIAIAAPIRLLAFKHLGQNFTFRLAKPNALVKTGLYAYVQHPSYPTNWLVLASNVALLLRLDGVFGCVLPTSVVRWGMGSGRVGVWPALLVGLEILGLLGIWVRVNDEEAMLKREVGKEWEEYHQRTKRFIPGVF
ncbi:isoprenylcysteine carboxyl methyltransferase [Dactylonectria estremocensis]|uniref:Protein-S-isoprenylcysteine O-methyltransferase n=1 Tax=Dactylonectria estremocensis TaxID=1079267 RepID=A0A9P9DQR9_9HYPO|nr:isoprenylcysteine carboxyl methyltransferase [Dactylonectria estremocensis]